MLTIPAAAAVADPAAVGAAALVGAANQSAPPQPTDLGPIVTPVRACATHPRWVKPRGTEGGQYAGTHADTSRAGCPRAAPKAATTTGARAAACAGSRPAAPKAATTLGTCGHQPRWVPGRGIEGGHYDYSAGASAIPELDEADRDASEAPSSGFDWGSAGIGAATVLGALAIALTAITGLRRPRITRPQMP
jgi:hypothetical protein